MDDGRRSGDGVFRATALRRHAEAGRVAEERLRTLPGRLFGALWLAAVALLAGLGAVLHTAAHRLGAP